MLVPIPLHLLELRNTYALCHSHNATRAPSALVLTTLLILLTRLTGTLSLDMSETRAQRKSERNRKRKLLPILSMLDLTRRVSTGADLLAHCSLMRIAG